jgi:hypothetical protein
VSWHFYGDRRVLTKTRAEGSTSQGTNNVFYTDARWQSGVVPRGYGLQIFLSLLHRGYTKEQINSKLFDHPTWRRYTIPQRWKKRHP